MSYQVAKLSSFKGLSIAEESTEADTKTLKFCQNMIGRPLGGLSKKPVVKKLWGLLPLRDYQIALGISSSDKTCLLLINMPFSMYGNTSKFSVLAAYSFSRQSFRGLFGLSYDAAGQYNAVEIDETFYDNQNYIPFDSNGIIVLKKGLHDDEQVNFFKFYDSIIIGNGVDDNLIFEIWRWRQFGSNPQSFIRKFGTSLTPGVPIAQLIQDTSNGQAVDASVTTQIGPDVSWDKFAFYGANDAKGERGNYLRINVAVATAASVGTPKFSSSRTGNFTQASPLIYTINIPLEFTGPGSALLRKRSALKEFIEKDPLATAILLVRTGWNNDTAAPDWYPVSYAAPVALTGGADAPNYTTWLNPGYIATSYYDSGKQFNEYATNFVETEFGTSSNIGSPVELFSSGKYLITPGFNSNPELSRFDKIQIWYKPKLTNPSTGFPTTGLAGFVTGTQKLGLNEKTWYLLGEVNNAPGQTFVGQFTEDRLTSKSILSDGEIAAPCPPCSMFEYSGDRVFAAGNRNKPLSIFYSYLSTPKEKIPERFLPEKQIINLSPSKDSAVGSKITYIKNLEGRLQVHTTRNITMVDSRTFATTGARADFGCVNSNAASGWLSPNAPYLGDDGNLYEFNNVQSVKSSILSEGAFSFLAGKANRGYINKFWMYGNLTHQVLLFKIVGKQEYPPGKFLSIDDMPVLPTDIPGNYQFSNAAPMLFYCDIKTKTLWGPILDTFNSIEYATEYSKESPVIIVADNNSKLNFIDLRYLNKETHIGNMSSSVVTLSNSYHIQTNPYPPDAELFFTTQLMDFGNQNEKTLFEIHFTLARGSKATDIDFFVFNEKNQMKIMRMGETTSEYNKCCFLHTGMAFLVSVRVRTNPENIFILRDMSFHYRNQNTR